MLTIRGLRWITVVVPTAFVVAFELVTRSLYGDFIPAWGHTVVILAAVSAGAFLFSTFVFATVSGLEREVRVRNRRLALVNAVAAEASESLDLEEVSTAIARNISADLGAEAVGVALASEEDGELRLVGQTGMSHDAIRSDGRLGPYDCDSRKAPALSEPVVVPDIREAGL